MVNFCRHQYSQTFIPPNFSFIPGKWYRALYFSGSTLEHLIAECCAAYLGSKEIINPHRLLVIHFSLSAPPLIFFFFSQMSQRATAVKMRHADLINKLGEFYTLLAQLGHVEPSGVKFPSPEAPASINRMAALGAGYTEEVVDLMEQLPYLTDEVGFWLEVWPSTETNDFTRATDVGGFESFRDRECDDAEEELYPESLLKLTHINIYGTVLLYDTQTCESNFLFPF